jgi:hypothetical protein
MWDDASIAALNPGVTLPAATPIVVVGDTQSAANAVWIAALRQADTQFGLQVAASATLLDLPVFAQSPNRTVVISNGELGVTMKSQLSFGMGYVPDILSVRGLTVGKLVTQAGKRATQVLEADTASVLAALNAFTLSTLPSDLILGTSSQLF